MSPRGWLHVAALVGAIDPERDSRVALTRSVLDWSSSSCSPRLSGK
jgi:hypothetical protein